MTMRLSQGRPRGVRGRCHKQRLCAPELQPQMKRGIIHILQDSGFNGSVERIPLEGKRGNEELIAANKITR